MPPPPFLFLQFQNHIIDSSLSLSFLQLSQATPMSSKPPFLSFLYLLLLPLSLAIPNPDPAIQPFLATPSAPPSDIIPAFPEQSNVAGCQLDLPEDLFHGVKAACGTHSHTGQQLHRSRCCPVLAAWLYTAYSATALSQAGRVSPAVAGRANETSSSSSTTPYDLPLLPDDSETCVDNLGKALEQRGMDLVRPNKSCDLVYCYCGIRLHPLTCPEAFSVDRRGKLVGDRSVKRLEKACSGNHQFPGLGGCNNCLNKLYLLNKKGSSMNKADDKRTTRMHDKDCQLMGLTWLLAKNRTAYIHTVSWVLRAMMMSTDGSDPRSCTLNSDGMPLAVDSNEFFDQSPSTALRPPFGYVSVVSMVLFCLLYIMELVVMVSS